MKRYLPLILLLTFYTLTNPLFTMGALDVPGGGYLNGIGIWVGGDVKGDIRDIASKWLSLARIIIAGIALVYMVWIGVDMVVNNSNEENIKKGKKQILYTLLGFFFLNTGITLVNIFTCTSAGAAGCTNPLFDSTQADTFMTSLMRFLEVLVFGIAIIILTYAAFELIVSWGNEEKKKKAKHRFVYGVIGLIVLLFIEFWWGVVGSFDISGAQTILSRILNIALFFAGPVAIFFLMLGAYYYITSAGDEEKTKRGKAIIMNTFIATIILLAAYTFLQDLITLVIN